MLEENDVDLGRNEREAGAPAHESGGGANAACAEQSDETKTPASAGRIRRP
jgi:hypothetical protein